MGDLAQSVVKHRPDSSPYQGEARWGYPKEEPFPRRGSY